MKRKSEQLLDLRNYLPWLDGEGWRGCVRGALERLLKLPEIWAIEEELECRAAAGEEPFAAFLAAAGIGLEEAGVCAGIPESGPLVVIANHPFGGADAIALPALCKRVRRDTMILANAEVCGIKAISPWMFPLEVMGGEQSERRNLKVLMAAMEHVRGGGLLVIFPAGAVSCWQSESARVEDPPWPDHTARMVGKLGVPVLPVRFHGQNPAWFQIVAKIHPFLRSGFIPRVFVETRGRTVRCSAGELIGAGEWPEEVGERTRFFREAVGEIR